MPDSSPLLRLALTHPSYAHEQGLRETNQRLEFLGDAVLGLFVGEMLYHRFPDLPEGELTMRRAALVCEESLAQIAQAQGLGSRLRLGRGEEQSGGREKPSVLADTFEAVLGARYLEHGIEETRNWVKETFSPLLDHPPLPLRDARSRLQELAQDRGLAVEFRLLAQDGPPHRPTFTMAALIDGAERGRGDGSSKQEATAKAAAVAYRALKEQGFAGSR
ncbi:MAG: ribonuclease III [Thermaerobacter sp.]|nr:ribonuclease III [Thermaerobacter sp.]